MRHQYPSVTTREQFARIRPLLAAARMKTKPRHADLSEVFRACSTYCAVGVNGECSRQTFRSGAPAMNILRSGVRNGGQRRREF